MSQETQSLAKAPTKFNQNSDETKLETAIVSASSAADNKRQNKVYSYINFVQIYHINHPTFNKLHRRRYRGHNFYVLVIAENMRIQSIMISLRK